MATLVCFHAHPDDECITTGGVMAKAAAEGHRVVLVTATRGEHGEVADGFLRDGESLWERRVLEVEAAAKALGVQRQEFLGYVDSGMMGVAENERPDSFWQADVDAAGERLAAILREEDADVLTIYDARGGYGHPDHIQVHRVGSRAAELAGTRRVYEATMDRDRMVDMLRLAAAGEGPGAADPGMAEAAQAMLDGAEDDLFGSPAALITTRVDVSAWVDAKREAMRAHASQIPADSWFLTMPSEAFAMAFGIECFIRHGGGDGGGDAEDLLGGLT